MAQAFLRPPVIFALPFCPPPIVPSPFDNCWFESGMKVVRTALPDNQVLCILEQTLIPTESEYRI